jgi:MFS family permease
VSVEAIIRAYFAGEKFEAGWILLAGAIALALAAWLWFGIREPFARGLAASLLLTAALGLSVGGTVYLRTDRQVSALVELQRADPPHFAAEEGQRVRAVVRSFGQYRIGYAVAVLLALLLVFAIGTPRMQGVAVGLLVLAALGFTIDFFAEHRAVVYEQALIAQGAIGPGSSP